MKKESEKTRELPPASLLPKISFSISPFCQVVAFPFDDVALVKSHPPPADSSDRLIDFRTKNLDISGVRERSYPFVYNLCFSDM